MSWPVRHPQRLAFGDLESEAQAGRIDDGGEHCSEAHVRSRFHGAGIDDAVVGSANLRAPLVLDGDVERGLRRRHLGVEAVAGGAVSGHLVHREEVGVREPFASSELFLRLFEIGLRSEQRRLGARRLETVPLGI